MSKNITASGFHLNCSHFQYIVADKIDARFKFHIYLKHGLILSYTSLTRVLEFEYCSYMVTIVGLCIDSKAELERDDIPSHLAKSCWNINSLIDQVGRFAGKYVIIFQDSHNTYVLTDATSSLPVYYSVDNGFFSSSEHLLANLLGLKKSSLAIKIQSQAIPNINLPYNITHYKNQLFLLPNHYLDFNKRSFHRYFVPSFYLSNLTTEEAAGRSLKLIQNILKEYSKYYQLLIPLTAGEDSRVVLSFFTQEKAISSSCFTLDYQAEDNRESPEITLPREICKDLEIDYEKLIILSTPETYLNKAYKIIGKNNINSQRIDIAYTLNNKYSNQALVFGDLIDQIGRSKEIPPYLKH